MDAKPAKAIVFTIALVAVALIIWYAANVFLIAFAALLLAILLNAIGRGTQKLIKLPYPISLVIGLIVIAGVLTLIFWLYSPVIAEQFELLIRQLPKALDTLREHLISFFGTDMLSFKRLQEEFSFTNQKLFSQLLTVFSSTVGSVVGFVIFIIVGIYMAFDPQRYQKWILSLIPHQRQEKVQKMIDTIDYTLRWWTLGKLMAMVAIGILAYTGLRIMNISLAFILGLLAAILTFIPYVGAILAAIPGILIGLIQGPLMALYVTLLYIGIHFIEGYFITPYIEQKTVSIPPAVTIMSQVLMVTLVGGLGLALATPIAVVGIAIAQFAAKGSSLKVRK